MYRVVNKLFTGMKPYVLAALVWEYLLEMRECPTDALVTHFEELHYTKQGVYRVLRQLEKEGKILKLRGYVAVNLMWVQDEIEKLTSLSSEPRIFFDTFDTKRVYRMHTLEELDRVWGQLFVLLLASLKEPLKYALFYDLHNYTYIHKVPIVEWYIRELYKKAPKICLLVGSESPLDTLLKEDVKNISLHLAERKWPYFVAVIGEYVIYNHLDKRVWGEVDRVFEGIDIGTAREELLFLSRRKGSYKIVVERNPKKAEEFKRYFEKYFVLPK
jgi:hypothetical protein